MNLGKIRQLGSTILLSDVVDRKVVVDSIRTHSSFVPRRPGLGHLPCSVCGRPVSRNKGPKCLACTEGRTPDPVF